MTAKSLSTQSHINSEEQAIANGKNRRTLKSFFLPRDQNNNNPYQNQLINHLATLNVGVEGAQPGSFFLFSVLKSRADILHLHWLHSFFIKSSLLKSLTGAFLFLGQLVILRLLGIRIVWTVHNLKNHNNRYYKLDQICTALVAKITHAIVAHCEAAKQEIIHTFNLTHSDKIFAVPHGNYIGCYENTVSQTEARQILGIPDSKLVFLFLGLIRPYKGVLELIDTFNQLENDEAQLIIAGKIWNDSLEQAQLLYQKVDPNKNIHFIPGFVEDDRIQIYMNACDVVVFPYRDILTSGAVLLALSFGRACIAPRMGCIAEVLDDAGSFLYDPTQENGLMQAVQAVVQKRDDLAHMAEHNQQLAKQYNWERIAEMTRKVYEWCLDS